MENSNNKTSFIRNLDRIKIFLQDEFDLVLSDKCRRTPYLEAREFFVGYALKYLTYKFRKPTHQFLGEYLGKNQSLIMNIKKRHSHHFETEKDYRDKCNYIYEKIHGIIGNRNIEDWQFLITTNVNRMTDSNAEAAFKLLKENFLISIPSTEEYLDIKDFEQHPTIKNNKKSIIHE